MNVSEVNLGEQVHVIVLQQAVRNANIAVGPRLKTCDHSPNSPLAAASRAEVTVGSKRQARAA